MTSSPDQKVALTYFLQVEQWIAREEVSDGSCIHLTPKSALEQPSFTLSREEEEVSQYLYTKQCSNTQHL